MKDNKNYSDNNYMPDTVTPGEYKDGSKMPLSRFDFELFDEDKNIPEPVFRVKRTNTPSKGERWKLFKNDELIFTIEGQKISKKERLFLRTLDGVSFLLKESRTGFNSLHELRGRLKSKV